MENTAWLLVEYEDRRALMTEVAVDELGTGIFATRKVVVERQRVRRLPSGIITNVVRVT